MAKVESFSPNWASPPGHSIEDALEELGMTQAELADRMGCTKKHVSQLINGKVALTVETSLKLEQVLDIPAGFWQKREAQFRSDLLRLERIKDASSHSEWLKMFPVSSMVKLGWIRGCNSPGEKVLELLKFFAVTSVDAWEQTYRARSLAFRSSPTSSKSRGAIFAWMRKCTLEAQKVRTEPIDDSKLKKMLPGIRKLTQQSDPELFVPILTDSLGSCGIAVVFVVSPQGCPVSGAVWKHGIGVGSKRVVALTLRYKTNDQLWFTLFHELAHILLHSSQTAILEGIDGLDQDLENEANAFAANVLIPEEAYSSFVSSVRRPISRQDVERFALGIEIAPGIVVGRLQRDGHLPFQHLKDLQIKYALEV